MRLLVLGLRNLGRNKRRTLITALAVAFGAVAIVFLSGFGNGFITAQIETSVLSKVGAVQVFQKGYLGADQPLEHTMAQDPALIARLAALPGVTGVAPRIDFEGMLSNGSDATVFVATAIDPAVEYVVCPKRATAIAPGSKPLRPGDDRGVLVGRTLTDALGAGRGATLVMQSAGAHAGTNALDVTVEGFLPAYNIAESKRGATVTLRFAQELLRMKGRVTELAVGVADLAQADQVAARVRGVVGDGYEVTTWRQLDPVAVNNVKTVTAMLGVIALVLFLLVATGIVNSMLMSVFERVREIGTMLAVGVRRRQVRLMFLWEASALGLSAGICGVALGRLIVGWIGSAGVTMHRPGGQDVIIRPHVDLPTLAGVVAFSVAGAALSALYPAWKASRLRPVEALHSN